ncbi:MAG: hypothetical protein II295_06950 [Akkermansia sp.]|nr:hypothetical protein [Akkermansia sp.]
MSPALTSLLTLGGVIVAGLPLLWLTAPAKPTPNTIEQQAPATMQEVYLTVHFSGSPSAITLRHDGATIAAWQAPTAELTAALQLPMSDTLELEAEAHWQPDTTGSNAITITLEPANRESRSCTRWGDALLHDIFTFTW